MSDPVALHALARWLCCGHRGGGCIDEAKNYHPPGECEGLDLVNATPDQLDLADVVAAAVREQVARDIEAESKKLEQWSSLWSRPLTMAAAIARGGDHVG